MSNLSCGDLGKRAVFRDYTLGVSFRPISIHNTVRYTFPSHPFPDMLIHYSQSTENFFLFLPVTGKSNPSSDPAVLIIQMVFFHNTTKSTEDSLKILCRREAILKFQKSSQKNTSLTIWGDFLLLGAKGTHVGVGDGLAKRHSRFLPGCPDRNSRLECPSDRPVSAATRQLRATLPDHSISGKRGV